MGQDFEPSIESIVVVFAVLSHLPSEIGLISVTVNTFCIGDENKRPPTWWP